MMQRPTRYFASFALCLFLSLITAPSPTSVVMGLDLGRLAGAAIAFSIGASLGRASRGKFLLNKSKINMKDEKFLCLILKVV